MHWFQFLWELPWRLALDGGVIFKIGWFVNTPLPKKISPQEKKLRINLAMGMAFLVLLGMVWMTTLI